MSGDELRASGNAAFKAERFEEAIKLYSKAIETDPMSENMAALYSNRAACWQKLSNWSKALEDSERCIEVKPTWLKGYFRKGEALSAMKKYDEALKAFQQALKTEPTNDSIQERLQQLNTMLKKRNESMTPTSCKTADDAKTIGNSMFSAGKYESAALFYSRAIELCTDKSSGEMANYYANRAACHQQTHSYQQVIGDCDKALAINASHVKALVRRAIAYEGLEKWKSAFDDYSEANRLAPGMTNVSQGVLRCQRALRQ